MRNLPNIFEYYDYRKYLRDCYENLHKQNENFSYRYIQEKTGIDPGFLVKVFNGQKNLTEKPIESFAKLFQLSKRQTKYFTLLILFGRAKSGSEIKHYFEKLLSFSELGAVKIDADSYELYSNWYNIAVREVLAYYPFKGNYDELAKMVIPAIKPAEAKKAVALLYRLKVIRKKGKSGYELTSRFITTGKEWQSIAIRNFQQQTIQLAKNALENIPKDQRDISTVTVTLSSQSFERLREKLKEFRQEILKIAQQEDNASGAYHVNFQMIPIGKHWPEQSS